MIQFYLQVSDTVFKEWNGIVFNRQMFQFCKDEVYFAGFLVGKDYVKPAPKILDSIKSFPVPKSISDIRGWFGLLNQVSPVFASRPLMQPFREMLNRHLRANRFIGMIILLLCLRNSRL